MTQGLRKSLEVLATTKNEAAVSTLEPALESSHDWIRDGAMRALLRRSRLNSQRVALSHLSEDRTRWLEMARDKPGCLTLALREAVIELQDEALEHACQAAVWLHEYDLIPTLITEAERIGEPRADVAAAALLKLCRQLSHELAEPRDYRRKRDPHTVRHNVLAALGSSTRQYQEHRQKSILEAFLMLVPRENSTLKKILREAQDPCHLVTIDLLSSSRDAGTMRLLLSFLDDLQISAAALTVLARRRDPRFVRHLLEKMATQATATVRRNLARINEFAWLESGPAAIEGFDDIEQAGAVILVTASALNRRKVLAIVRQVVTQGKPVARRAAVKALEPFDGAEANALILAAVEDDDSEVEALAVAQVRPRGLPNGMALLIDKLNSPHEVVQDAARGGLSEFTFRRFVAAYETLDDDVQESTGKLVKKVDLQTVPSLAREIDATVRTRRLSGLRLARIMHAVTDLEEPIIRCLLADEDHVVRVEAARALALAHSPAARGALQQAQSDSSVLVQREAEASLAAVESSPQAPPVTWTASPEIPEEAP